MQNAPLKSFVFPLPCFMLGLTQTCGTSFVCFFSKAAPMLKTHNLCFRCLHKTRSAAVPSTTDLKGFSNLGFIGSNGHIISASSTVDLDKVPGPLDATAMKQPLKKANTFPYQVWSLSQFCSVKGYFSASLYLYFLCNFFGFRVFFGFLFFWLSTLFKWLIKHL